YQKLSNISSRFRVYSPTRDYIEVGNRLQYLIPDNEATVNRDRRIEDYFVSAGLRSKYLDLVASVVLEGNEVRKREAKLAQQQRRRAGPPADSGITAWQTMAVLKPPGECWSLIY